MSSKNLILLKLKKITKERTKTHWKRNKTFSKLLPPQAKLNCKLNAFVLGQQQNSNYTSLGLA